MTDPTSIVQRAAVALLCCLLVGGGAGLVSSQQAAPVPVQPATGASASVGVTPPQIGLVSEEQKKSNAWMAHPLYLPSFDPKVLALPDLQVAFVRNMTANDLVLFREIVEEALRIRNKWTPSVKLMFKYAGRLLGNFIRNRRAEQRIPVRVEPKPDFFNMLADLMQSVLDRSAEIKREKGYSKSTVDEDTFKTRVFAIFDNVQRVINASPLGGYHKWTEIKLFTDEPKNPLHKGNFIEEISDLVAQFRSMGYESTVFVARRIVNLLRLFGRGIIPSDDSEV